MPRSMPCVTSGWPRRTSRSQSMAARPRWAAARRAPARTDPGTPQGEPYADTSTIFAGRGGKRARRFAGLEAASGFVTRGTAADHCRDPAATRSPERAAIQPGRDAQWLDTAVEDDRWRQGIPPRRPTGRARNRARNEGKPLGLQRTVTRADDRGG